MGALVRRAAVSCVTLTLLVSGCVDADEESATDEANAAVVGSPAKPANTSAQCSITSTVAIGGSAARIKHCVALPNAPFTNVDVKIILENNSELTVRGIKPEASYPQMSVLGGAGPSLVFSAIEGARETEYTSNGSGAFHVVEGGPTRGKLQRTHAVADLVDTVTRRMVAVRYDLSF